MHRTLLLPTPKSFRAPGKRPGTTRAKSISDATAHHSPEIFSKLIALPQICRLRRSHHLAIPCKPMASAWNRDVLGALNIGCLFLAQSLELDPGLWKRGTVATTSPLSWAEIFGRAGHALPFSPPSALLPNGS